MKVLLVGFKPVAFTPRGEQQEKRGLSLYYTAESPECIGLFADNVWIDAARTPEWYDKFSSMDFEEPVEAEFVYEMIPGRQKAVLTVININA